MNSRVSVRSTVLVTKEQVSADVGGEAVILSLKDGVYYGLDSVGARVWKLLQEKKTLSDVRDALLKEYEVEAERLERDLLTVVEELLAKGLLEIKDETLA